MGFVKFSSDFLTETFTLVDNLFISEHLPYCDEKQIKVYLYGLYLCSSGSSDLDVMSAKLDMTEAEIRSAYAFFEDMGLVQILSQSPLEIKYLSLKRGMQPPKKYKSEKWNDFNTQLQQLFPDRMISTHEFIEYYDFIESSHIETDAMLLIVQHCINTYNGASVRYPYVLTVAREWTSKGVRTVKDVEQRLEEYDSRSEQMRQILAALGRKSGADLEEMQMLGKWTRSWGYDIDAILAAIKTIKGAKTFKKLDSRLDEFYRMDIFSAAQMDNYRERREALADLAVQINKNLGVFYESIDHEIEVYVSPWTAKGFESDALIKIAHHCFVTNIRTLDGMNRILDNFYAQGLLSADSIDAYFARQIEQDDKIRKVIEACGLNRSIIASDRTYYRTWTANWGFDDDLVLYAAAQAMGRTYPLPYVNQLLSSFKEQGVRTVEEAKKIAPNGASGAKKSAANFEQRAYTDEEIRSVLTSIDSLKDGDL